MTRPTFLPWWQCAAVIFDGEDEIDLDAEVRAATAGEAEDVARADWNDLGYNPENVKVRRVE